MSKKSPAESQSLGLPLPGKKLVSGLLQTLSGQSAGRLVVRAAPGSQFSISDSLSLPWFRSIYSEPFLNNV